jgi:hypothetical protein
LRCKSRKFNKLARHSQSVPKEPVLPSEHAREIADHQSDHFNG